MINQDCIYRWSLDDLISYYEGEEIDTEKYITIKGERYLLCSTDITEENIIKQFQIINPELNVYIKPKDEWDEIKETLTKQGLSKSKIIRTINKMKSKGITLINIEGSPLNDEKKYHVLEPYGDKLSYIPSDVSCGMTIEVFERGPRETSLIHQRDDSWNK